MLPSKRQSLALWLVPSTCLAAFIVPASGIAAPLNGSYTVGSGGNYATIAAATAAVTANGVSGPVTFQIKDGTYTAQIALSGNISGASAVNRVRFVSLNNNAALVTVQAAAALNDGSDAVVALNGTKYVSVEKMTLAGTGASSNIGSVVWLNGGATDNRVLDCVLNDAGGPSRLGFYAVPGSAVDRLELRRNRVNGFYYGIYLYNSSAASSVVDANTVITSGYGLDLEYLSGAGVVVSNNFVVAQGASAALTCNYNTDLTLAFNSMSCMGTYGLFANVNSVGQTLTVKSNILSAPGGGYAYYIYASGGGTVVTDYNDVSSTGATLAAWNGTSAADLAALKVASGQESHSVSFSPGYTSATDLHTHLVALNGAATPVAGITTDIDGETRNVTTPDIGADEFSPLMPLSGNYTVGSGGTYATVAAAVADLMSKGVAAAVTFQLKDGTYAEQIAIAGIPPGASAANRVRFVSLNNNAALVTVQAAAALSDGSDAAVRLSGAKYVSVEKLTLAGTGGLVEQRVGGVAERRRDGRPGAGLRAERRRRAVAAGLLCGARFGGGSAGAAAQPGERVLLRDLPLQQQRRIVGRRTPTR
jgi:hypothetical protein